MKETEKQLNKRVTSYIVFASQKGYEKALDELEQWVKNDYSLAFKLGTQDYKAKAILRKIKELRVCTGKAKG